MNLRNYQQDAHDAVFSEWENKATSTLLVFPTGCGKTVVFSHIIKNLLPKRSIVIAHREELIWQARDKIKNITGVRVEVEMGSYKAEVDRDLLQPTSPVVVSTVQTLTAGGDGGGRLSKFNPEDFGLVVIDEAHHATSPSYRRVIEHFKRNDKLKFLGVTATPDRADEEALGQIFDTVAFDYEILDAIRDGWLVPVEQQFVSTVFDGFENIRTTAGDLNGADLAAVMESEKSLHSIAHPTIEIVGNRRGIGFASSVEQARLLSEIFNRHRPGMSNWVSGKTEKEDRRKIVADFAAGRVQWLWNCGVFTEGFDDAGVEVISMARPTKSRSLYAQMAGRATRPHGSIATRLNSMEIPALRKMAIQRSPKPNCLIIDFVGNSGRHKLMTTADVLGGNVSDEAMEAAVTTARTTGRPMRMAELLEEEEKRVEEKKKRELEEQARKARLVAKASYKKQSVDPFDILQIKPVKERGWDRGKSFSEGQRNFLRNLGTDPDSLNYASGKRLMDEIGNRRKNGLCTLPQAKQLKRFGFTTDLTFDQARKTIDAIANNGWKRPKDFVIPAPENKPQQETPPPRRQVAPLDDNIPF